MGLELVAIVGVLMLGAGVMLLVANLRRETGSTGLLDQIGTYGYVAEVASRAAEAPGRRPLDRLAGWLGDLTARRVGRFSEAELRMTLLSAGMYGTTPRKLLGYQVILAIFLATVTLWLVPVAGGSGILAILVGAGAGVLGWFLPTYYVKRRRRLRFEAMDRQMPDMIDLLVVTIEAGLGILASMRVAAESLPDPLGQELRLTLQEQRMGLSVNEAIESLSRRADCSNMRIFVRSLTQGEKLGVSIGTTMRNLALEMRKRRKAMIEETAQKIPIKMLFPLAFLIFPAMFIVLLVPAFIKIFEVL
ncbi:MAG: type II secretion system F family protein [Actinobacteria bacterium]|nr:type II secretion system F family protein [Actinomycetota bacterium]